MDEYRATLQLAIEKHGIRLLTLDPSKRIVEITAMEVPNTFAQLRLVLPETPVGSEIFDLPAKAGAAVTFAPIENNRQLIAATVGAKAVWHKDGNWYENPTPIKIARLVQGEFRKMLKGKAFFRRENHSTVEKTFVRYSAGALRRYEEGASFSFTTSNDPAISYFIPDVKLP